MTMANNLVHIAGAAFVNMPIQQSAYGDFVWEIELFDGEGGANPTDLTGCEFAFTLLGLDGAEIDTYEPTFTGNDVRVEILLEDWADWAKNCNLKYRLLMTKADGTRFPLFAGTFMLIE